MVIAMTNVVLSDASPRRSRVDTDRVRGVRTVEQRLTGQTNSTFTLTSGVGVELLAEQGEVAHADHPDRRGDHEGEFGAGELPEEAAERAARDNDRVPQEVVRARERPSASCSAGPTTRAEKPVNQKLLGVLDGRDCVGGVPADSAAAVARLELPYRSQISRKFSKISSPSSVWATSGCHWTP